LKAYKSALAIRRKLADDQPTVTEYLSDLATSHNNIGNLLSETGKPAEALKASESALAIRRKLADDQPTVTRFLSDLTTSHSNIGLLLNATGKPAEALKAYESALAIQQKLADDHPTITQFLSHLALSHNNIGVLLRETGKPAEALKAYESALAIQRKLAREHPESPEFASSLGASLNNLAMIDLDAKRFEEGRVRLREAVEWQRKALATNPVNPTYRQFLTNHFTGLIMAAKGLGDAEGVAEARKERETVRDSDPAMAALNARLSAILGGGQSPKDQTERLKLARRAYEKALHVVAARLWAEALAADPKLVDDRQAQHRYAAACAAALAGCGKGQDDPSADDAARAKLRRQALDWLKAELSIWSNLIDSGPPQARPTIAQTLKHWQEDTDLPGIRDPEELAKLPADERAAFQQLWDDVNALLARVGERK
jgi:tetratricopeptide (TPR) repeat protein